jgi:hypothetical protein
MKVKMSEMSPHEAVARVAETTGRCPSCDEYTVECARDEDGELVSVFCGDPDCGWRSEVFGRPRREGGDG